MWIVLILKGIPITEEIFRKITKIWYPEDYVEQETSAYESDYYWMASVGDYNIIVCGGEAVLCYDYQIYDGGNNSGLERLEDDNLDVLTKFKKFVGTLDKDIKIDTGKIGTYINHAYYDSEDED